MILKQGVVAGGQVKFKCHSIKPAFAITYHKLQGKTVSKIVLDLRKKPGICINGVTFEGLYFGWTRVCKGADISVIPCGNCKTFYHPRKLRPCNNLIAWMKGFGQHTSDQIRGWSAESAMGSWRVLNSDLGEGRQGEGGPAKRGRARQGGGHSASNLDLQTRDVSNVPQKVCNLAQKLDKIIK
jgi:hypothetical protein